MNIAKRMITQTGKWIVSIIEAILFTKAQEFIPAQQFYWTSKLEENYSVILEEFKKYYTKDNIPFFDDISPPQKTIVEKNKWKSLILFAFNKINPAYETAFPKTNTMIHAIPGITSAMFSVLDKHTHIKPHRGVYKGLLRFHLGIIIPVEKNNCYIIVNGNKRYWETGKCMVFDDTYIHEAFNNSEEERIILLIDFLRPATNEWKNKINKWIIFLLSKSPLVTEITDVYSKNK